MNRFLLSCVILLSTLTVAADNGFHLVTLGPETSLWAIGLSPNGRYMSCWLGTDGAGSALYDTYTDEYYYYTSWSEYDAVSDTGLMVGYGANIFAYNPLTEEEYVNPDDCDIIGRGVNADGTVVVGSNIENGYQYRACYYEDGEVHFLVLEPNTHYGQESQAMDVSDDKSIICGYTNSGITLWHRTADGSYEAETITAFRGQPTAMSHNGRYVALDMNSNGIGYIGRYDIETGELEAGYLYNSYGRQLTCSATRVSNDGTIMAHTNDSNSQSRRPLIWEKGGDVEYMADKYPEVSEFLDFDDQDWNYPTNISADGRYIIGMAWTYIEGYDEYWARRVSWLFDREEYAEAVGIHEVTADITPILSDKSKCYTLDGRQVSTPQKGINLVRSGNTVKKIIVQ